MCGIAGLLARRAVDPDDLAAMTDRLAHRGPDDRGVWIDEERRVGLGHRRLAIVDLSPQGAQPMLSRCGRYVLVYNGEIYNHVALRREVEEAGHGPGERGWHGHSDTETLLAAIAGWGLEAALARCVGMFAFGLWDRKARRLQLVRDRFGEKPLYFGWSGGDFVFASELKSIRGRRGFDNAVDTEALRLLAARSYIPAPLSIYRGLYKLQPGCILTLDEAAAATPVERPAAPLSADGLRIDRYWDYRTVVEQGLADPIRDETEAIAGLEEALAAAVRGQSVADVPVGAFLSGGIDSSLVVAMYRAHGSGRVRTFSIGFAEAGFDEAVHARAVAQHLGTEHAEHYVSVDEARAVIPLLPTMYDEPFADSSQIPTYLVSKFARRQVTVALSGDGGDELFGGYTRYLATARLWRAIAPLPGPARRALGQGLGLLPPAIWDRGAAVLRRGNRPYFGTKVRKMLHTIGRADRFETVFDSFLDEWTGQPSPVLGAATSSIGALDLAVGQGAGLEQRMMYGDAVSYLPDDILCKVDRAAMAVSLETRVPFMDHRVAAFAARVPVDLKFRGGKGKWLLRALLHRHVPAALLERPKAGFALPIGPWLRGPLRDWAEDLLSASALAGAGVFDPRPIRERWAEHLAGKRDASFTLWPILMYQAWSRR